MSRSTFSKHPLRYPEGYPQVIVSGNGPFVWSEGYDMYIDWVQGLGGSGIFGHAPAFLQEVYAEAEKGLIFHLPSVLENEVAEMLCEILPFADDVRFCINGTDATAGAVRLARAVTKRDTVLIFEGAYHGESSADWAIAAKLPARGVPNFTHRPAIAQWNDLQSVVDAIQKTYMYSSEGGSISGHHNVAAIIFEVGEAPTGEFAQGLRDVCDDYGIVLIADEIVTGFRLALGGACEVYDIKPDLACYGKALGSGVPVACVAGKQALMQEFDLAHTNSPVFMSMTHSGNALGLAAAKVTLSKLKPIDYEHLDSIGSALMKGFRDLAYDNRIESFAYVGGQPARHSFKFNEANGVKSHEILALFQQKLAEEGVLVGWTNCPTVEHTGPHVNETLDAIDNAFRDIVLAVEYGDIRHSLKGEVPVPLYVRKVDD